MEERILQTIKTMLGGAVDNSDDAFDTELTIHINSVLATLNQIGIGRFNYRISDGTETWADFFRADEIGEEYSQVKDYVYLRVKKLFDPPQSGSLADAIDEQLKEFEWRLHNLANY